MDGLVVAPLDHSPSGLPPVLPRRRNESARHHRLKEIAAALVGTPLPPRTEVRYPGGRGVADVAACGVYVECGHTDPRKFALRLRSKRVREIWWLPYVGAPRRYRRGTHFFERMLEQACRWRQTVLDV